VTADERETPASVWAGRRTTTVPRRPALTREAIVAAALRLADAEGLAAVSMRRIATELDARTMSLYHHVARKEDLIALMADAVSAEVLVPEPLPSSWREAITCIVRRERDVAQRHPWMVDVVAMQLEVGPNMLRHAEQTLAALAELRLSPQDAIQVSAAIDHYVLGHTLRERWDMFIESDATQNAERAALVLRRSPVLAELAEQGELPFLVPVLDAGFPSGADSFEQGLAWLLDGIERDLADRAQ
jgi:AcrR family transcriptional regulator